MVGSAWKCRWSSYIFRYVVTVNTCEYCITVNNYIHKYVSCTWFCFVVVLVLYSNCIMYFSIFFIGLHVTRALCLLRAQSCWT